MEITTSNTIVNKIFFRSHRINAGSEKSYSLPAFMNFFIYEKDLLDSGVRMSRVANL